MSVVYHNTTMSFEDVIDVHRIKERKLFTARYILVFALILISL
jgi:hypothetical protein